MSCEEFDEMERVLSLIPLYGLKIKITGYEAVDIAATYPPRSDIFGHVVATYVALTGEKVWSLSDAQRMRIIHWHPAETIDEIGYLEISIRKLSNMEA